MTVDQRDIMERSKLDEMLFLRSEKKVQYIGRNGKLLTNGGEREKQITESGQAITSYKASGQSEKVQMNEISQAK